MWGTGLEERHEYCFDFVETGTNTPVNSPFNYRLFVTPNKKTPWLPGPPTEIYSLERSFGLAQEEILEGEEKFVLLEGTACLLVIIASPPVKVYFEAPIRPRTIHLGDVNELDFQSEFYFE